jgi:hypothetical protein
MSVLGGVIMGVVFVLDLLMENRGACWNGSASFSWMWKMVLWGGVAGLGGSLVRRLSLARGRLSI